MAYPSVILVVVVGSPKLHIASQDLLEGSFNYNTLTTSKINSLAPRQIHKAKQ
jgi:hypothetical protein